MLLNTAIMLNYAHIILIMVTIVCRRNLPRPTWNVFSVPKIKYHANWSYITENQFSKGITKLQKCEMTMHNMCGLLLHNYTINWSHENPLEDVQQSVYFPRWQLICTLPLQHFWDLASKTRVPQHPGCVPEREFTTPPQHIWDLESKTRVPQQPGRMEDREFTTLSQHIWDLASKTRVPQQPGRMEDREFTIPSQHIWDLASKTWVPQQPGRMPDREFTTPLQHIWNFASNDRVPQQPGRMPDLALKTPLQQIWVR